MKIRCKGCGNIFEVKDKTIKIVKCPDCGAAYNNPSYKEIKDSNTQDLKNNINEMENKAEDQNIENKKEIKIKLNDLNKDIQEEIEKQEEDFSDSQIFDLEEEQEKEEDLNFSDNEFVGICSKCSRAVYGKNFGELNKKLICKTCYEEKKKYDRKFIGICLNCGKAVYGINCGRETPKVLCKDCLDNDYSRTVVNKIKKEGRLSRETSFSSSLKNIDKKKLSIIISSVLAFVIAFSLLFAFVIPINIDKSKVSDILLKADVLGVDEDIYFVSTTKNGKDESKLTISMKKNGDFWKESSDSEELSFAPCFEYYDSKNLTSYIDYSKSIKVKSKIDKNALQSERKNIYTNISAIKTSVKSCKDYTLDKAYKKGGVITIIFKDDGIDVKIKIKNNMIIEYYEKLEYGGLTYEETVTIKNKYVDKNFDKSIYKN